VLGFQLVQWSLHALNRWWEARGHLGDVTHYLHALAMKIALCVSPTSTGLACALLQTYLPICALVVLHIPDAHTEVLRDQRTSEIVNLRVLPTSLHLQLLSSGTSPRLTLTFWIGMHIEAWAKGGQIGRYTSAQMSAMLMQLDSAARGIEKIATTPMPSFYLIGNTVCVMLVVWLLLPFAMAYMAYQNVTPESLETWREQNGQTMTMSLGGLVIGLVGGLSWMLHAIGSHFEQPFGDDPYDLPLLPLVNKMHKDLESIFKSPSCLPAELRGSLQLIVGADGAPTDEEDTASVDSCCGDCVV